VSIITILVSGPVTYIDLYRPSFETTGPENYGPGLTTVSYADRASNEPRTDVYCLLGRSPVIILYGMPLTPLI